MMSLSNQWCLHILQLVKPAHLPVGEVSTPPSERRQRALQSGPHRTFPTHSLEIPTHRQCREVAWRWPSSDSLGGSGSHSASRRRWRRRSWRPCPPNTRTQKTADSSQSERSISALFVLWTMQGKWIVDRITERGRREHRNMVFVVLSRSLRCFFSISFKKSIIHLWFIKQRSGKENTFILNRVFPHSSLRCFIDNASL